MKTYVLLYKFSTKDNLRFLHENYLHKYNPTYRLTMFDYKRSNKISIYLDLDDDDLIFISLAIEGDIKLVDKEHSYLKNFYHKFESFTYLLDSKL